MPTVLRVGPFRFYFYSGDGGEPMHVHVQRDRSQAKFWLQPTHCASAAGFTRLELREIQYIVTEHQASLVEAWSVFFNR
jgi:hypothetical protein